LRWFRSVLSPKLSRRLERTRHELGLAAVVWRPVHRAEVGGEELRQAQHADQALGVGEELRHRLRHLVLDHPLG